MYSFGHYSKDVKREYLQVSSTGLEKALDVFKEHILFVDGRK